MQVVLSQAKNEDIAGGYWTARSRSIAPKTVEVSSFAEASKVCADYIAHYQLGGGNWTGGKIIENGKKVGEVSYNGRVWDIRRREIKI